MSSGIRSIAITVAIASIAWGCASAPSTSTGPSAVPPSTPSTPGAQVLPSAAGSGGEVSGTPIADVTSYKGEPARLGRMPGPLPVGVPVALWQVATAPLNAPPAVADGVAYVGDASGRVHAIDLASGAERWPPIQLGGIIDDFATVDGDRLFVVSDDHRLHAIDRASGHEAWPTPFEGASSADVPLVVGDTVYVGGPNALIAISRTDGSKRWSVELKGGTQRSAFANGVIYVGGDGDGGLYAIDTTSRAVLWRFETGAPQVHTPAVADGVVYAVGQGVNGSSRIFAIDAASGTQKWEFGAPGLPTLLTASVGDRFVYAGVNGAPYQIVAIDRATGVLAWSTPVTGPADRLALVGDALIATPGQQVVELDAATGHARWSLNTGAGAGSGAVITGGFILVAAGANGQGGGLTALVGPADPRLAAVAASSAPSPSATTSSVAKWIGSFRYDTKPSLYISVALDRVGHLYVADMANNRILEFGADRKPLAAWGTTGVGHGQFDFSEVTPGDQTTSVAVAPDGTIAVGDGANHRVQLFDSGHHFLRTWGSLGTGAGQFVNPCCVAWSPSGSLYVADPGRNDIQVFDAAGKLIQTIGSAGSGNGQFARPAPPTFDAAGRMFVPDFANRRVEVFDRTGRYQASYGNDPSKGPPLDDTNGVAVDAAGRMYVVDTLNILTVLSAAGTVVARIGPTIDGHRVSPPAVVLGPGGRLYLPNADDSSPDGGIDILQLEPPLAP